MVNLTEIQNAKILVVDDQEANVRLLEGMLRVLLGQMGTEAPTWRFVLYPITLLLLMLIRPQGLLGSIEWGFLRPDRIVRRITGNGASASGPAAAQKGRA